MEAKNGLVPFGLLIVLFAFTFILSLDALAVPSTTYGVMAFVGFVVCMIAGLFLGLIARREGEALSLYFNVYSVVVAVVFVWYATRCGTAFGWW